MAPAARPAGPGPSTPARPAGGPAARLHRAATFYG